ncbi:zinc finger CCCH domain-containing protein 10 isoform X2 [Aplysia californica]|uniref:Zinc finger CCCH domain-containing protein 10 isoform X2 n=1 Tax=Aplysia californica TaxID=6500 RepID=A0ABM1VW50_APLCA|nr:zinc finger CCCH domain-containing protein 10 isoform X2 [Aplysia californica]
MSSKSDSGSEDASMSNGGLSSGGKSVNGGGLEQYEDDVCRDYMRNVCTRGKRCKYRHPVVEDRPEPPPRRDLTFCHDYQNNGCTRPSCKFLHCSRDEEEYFHRTGLLPSRLNYAKTLPPSNVQKADVPVCRDFLNGECKRGSKCKYRHVNGEYEASEKSSGDGGDRRHHDRSYDHGPEAKRRRADDDYDNCSSHTRGGGLSYSLLEEENLMLRRKLDELKKQVSDLTAINEVLLEQNARYRVSKAATAMHVPGTQHSLSAMAMGVGGAAAVSPAHAAGGQATMAVVSPSLTQQVALNSDLATQHALQTAAQQQRLAPPPAPAALTPTVTITQNVAAAGALGLTQSNLAVSMAPMNAAQLQVAHSLTQNLGAPSTSLVSYPIMSQNMRSAVEPSSLTH